MKENLKVEIPNMGDADEALRLFRDLKYLNLFADELFVYASDNLVTREPRIISFDELRELAKPREYLDENFKLVETNQPKDGWRLVPDGAIVISQTHENEVPFFYKSGMGSFMVFNPIEKVWIESRFFLTSQFHKILWQRNPQQETIMEKKGRFLHQDWMDKHIEGVLIQSKLNRQPDFCDIDDDYSFAYFNDTSREFRLKPKTIQIGERTIIKPIDVKPERNTKYYFPSLHSFHKYDNYSWQDTDADNRIFNANLCHLTSVDAINHCDALLELMK